MSVESKLATKADYNPQTKWKVERFDMTSVVRLRHYIDEHQTDWDLFVESITYTYNTQVHHTTRAYPFSLILSREPPVALTSALTTAEKNSLLNPTQF